MGAAIVILAATGAFGRMGGGGGYTPPPKKRDPKNDGLIALAVVWIFVGIGALLIGIFETWVPLLVWLGVTLVGFLGLCVATLGDPE